jgi:hypothetical protein
LKSCYIRSNATADSQVDIRDLSRQGLVQIIPLLDTPQRREMAAATFMFMRGSVNDDVSAIAVRGLISTGYLPHAVAALGVNQACSPKFGNIVRERILDSIAELCAREKDSSLNAGVAASIRDWLVPPKEERRLTVDAVETESAANFARGVLDEVREARGELVLPREEDPSAPPDRFVRAAAIRTLAEVTKQEPPQASKTVEALVILARDPEPVVRSAALIALGRLAEVLGEHGSAVARIVIKEREFGPKCAGVWCLQSRMEALGDAAEAAAEATNLRIASFSAFKAIRDSLQSNGNSSSLIQDPVLLDILSRQNQLSLVAPSSAEVNTFIHRIMHDLQLPEARDRVSIAALRILPHIADAAALPRLRVLEAVAGTNDIYNFSLADLETGRPETRALPESEVLLCSLLARTDSKRALGIAFQALRVASNRFAVTLQANSRPEYEQGPFLEAIASLALQDNAWRMAELLESGQRHFRFDDSHFAKLWKTTLLKAISVELESLEKSPDRAARGRLRSAVDIFTRDSDENVRDAADKALRGLSNPAVYAYTKLRGLLSGVTDSSSPSGASASPKPKQNDFQALSSGRLLRQGELDGLAALARFAPLKQVRVEAAQILLHDIRETEERNAAIGRVYESTNSIAVRGLLAKKAALTNFLNPA